MRWPVSPPGFASIFVFLPLVCLTLVRPALAQLEPVVLQPEVLEWKEIVPGISFAAAYGDWSKEGYGKFVRIDPGIAAAPHTHSGAYHGIVIAGTITNPFRGEDDPPKMGPGAYWYVPAGAEHSTVCVSGEPCLYYSHADSAWDFNPVEWPAHEGASAGR